MDKNIKTPIEALAFTLGEMTARAMEAQVKALELKLETEMEAHRKTRKDLQRALASTQKGEG